MIEFKNGTKLDNEKQEQHYLALADLGPEINQAYPWTEMGLAYLWQDIFGKAIRYCPDNKMFYNWRDGYWHREGYDGVVTNQLMELIDLLGLYIKEKSAEVGAEDAFDWEGYEKFVHSMQTYSHLKNICSIAKNLSEIWEHIGRYDQDGEAMNFAGFTYDLRTGKVYSEDEAYDKRITKRAATHMFVNGLDVKQDRWEQFISEIMSGDAEKARFLQRALGYSLLGNAKQECMFVAYGATTRNGKSTLFDAIFDALGNDYCNVISPQLICEKKNEIPPDYNSPQPALAKLVGVRIALMAESGRDDRLDAAAMKALTGRDTMMTRQLYGTPFEFKPQFTIWLNTNYLPAINDISVFSSNRVWVIPFERHFDANEQDKNLKDMFKQSEYRTTIVKWLMDGLRDYWECGGLCPPASVVEATSRYSSISDRVGTFLSESTEYSDSGWVKRGDLYMAYCAWCHRGEYRYNPMGSTSFYRQLVGKGYTITHMQDGWMVMGMRLK